jgi:hypothetical protein
MGCIHLGLVAFCLSLAFSACQDDDPFTLSPEELAEQIRRNTPTELPPITTSGENTMGAWIHPQPGSPLHDLEGDSLLFVASGVDRPETALAESLDCNAFNNSHNLTNRSLISSGVYCRRPEIGDDRQMNLSFGYYYPDSSRMFFIYRHTKTDRGINYTSTLIPEIPIDYQVLNDDRLNQIFSGKFTGRLINRTEPFDTIKITNGRFDVTYGTTP